MHRRALELCLYLYVMYMYDCMRSRLSQNGIAVVITSVMKAKGKGKEEKNVSFFNSVKQAIRTYMTSQKQ